MFSDFLEHLEGLLEVRHLRAARAKDKQKTESLAIWRKNMQAMKEAAPSLVTT